MKNRNLWVIIALALVTLSLSGCYERRGHGDEHRGHDRDRMERGREGRQ